MSSLPAVSERPDFLRARLRSASGAVLRDRVRLLLLTRSGAVTSLAQASERLGRHRNTLRRWTATYRAGGYEALTAQGTPGGPTGQRSITPHAFDALKARLANPDDGFASYTEAQAWLMEEHGIEIPYTTLHQIMRYGLRAKLKAPRPSHPKKA
jgi:transposase